MDFPSKLLPFKVEIENVARRPLKELEAQEFSKVEELQETLAEDSEPGHHGRGKRVAEVLQVGMPVKKRMKKAVMKMELEVESGQEESMDGVALEEGDREAASNEEVADFDVSLDLGHQEQVEGLEQKNHSSKGAKMFSCDLCEKKFTSEKGSRSHMTRIHGTAPRSGRRGRNINTESIVNQSHPSETVAEEGVEGGLNLEATESEDMFNSENQNSDDQIGFEQGNFGETSSVEMEDSMADDSADLERESKEMDDLTIEGAAITEDVNAIEKYQDVPAECDTSMDIADVAAIDQESNGRLMCSFGCGKTYGTKGSLANHEIKVHNRPKLKSRRSQKPTVDMKLEESGQDGTEATAEMGSSGEPVSQTEEADAPGASEQMLGGSTMQSGSLGDFDFEIQESEVGGDSVDEKDAAVEDEHVEATIEVGLTCSEGGEEMMHDEEAAAQDEERTNRGEGSTGHVQENTHPKDEIAVEREEATEQGGEATTKGEVTLDQGKDKDGETQPRDGDVAMTNEDQAKQDEDKQFGENVPEKQSGSLDIKGSEYFNKYPKAIANPQVGDILYCMHFFMPQNSLKLFKLLER